MKNNYLNHSESGYIALASVLVIAAVVLVISSSVGLLSINGVQSSLANKKSQETIDLVEACTEDALLYLNENNNLPATITLPQGTCSVTVDTQVGSDWTFTTEFTYETYTKSIQVTANRTNTVTITSWEEI